MYCVFLGTIQKGILAGCSDCSAKPACFSWIMWTFLCVEHFTWPCYTFTSSLSGPYWRLQKMTWGSVAMAAKWASLPQWLVGISNSHCLNLSSVSPFFLSLFLSLFSLYRLLDPSLSGLCIDITASRKAPYWAISVDPVARSICPSHRSLGITCSSDCQLRTETDRPC